MFKLLCLSVITTSVAAHLNCKEVIVNNWRNHCCCDEYNCRSYIQYQITCSHLQENELDIMFKTYNKGCNMTISESSIPVLYTTTPKDQVIQIFQLSRVNISKILPGFFVGIKDMTILLLDANNLTYLIDGTFSPLHTLKLLNLSQNNIKTLTDHTFTGMMSLETLDLSKNNISSITEDAFNFNFNLTSLNLSENALESVEWKSESLEKLDVSHNKLKSLEGITYRNLTDLDVSYNTISNVTNDFHNLTKVQSLNLTRNVLTDLLSGCFKSLEMLRHLDISHNKLSKIGYGVLDGLPNLQYLSVEANLLSKIDVYTFSLNQLQEFYFGYNFIDDIDVAELTKHAPFLRIVSLQSNGWRCDSLAKVIHSLKVKRVNIVKGENFNGTNIQGIKCNKGDENRIENNSGEKSYANDSSSFDKNFANGNFFKYLNGLNKADPFKDFDKNFENSNIYKHLQKMAMNKDAELINFLNSTFEKLVATLQKSSHTGATATNPNFDFQQLKNILSNNSFLNYIDRDFQNTDFYKYLESLKTGSKVDYSNGDFKNSDFYKYMEGFRSENREITPEKLIQDDSRSNGNGITYVNLFSNLLQITGLLLGIYAFMFFKNYLKERNLSEQNIQLV